MDIITSISDDQQNCLAGLKRCDKAKALSRVDTDARYPAFLRFRSVKISM